MAEQDSGALEALLAELEEEDRERHATMAYLRKRLGRQDNDGATVGQGGSGMGMSGRDQGTPGKIRPDEFFRMSIREAIKHYLGIMKQPQGPKAMADAILAGGLLTSSKNFYTTLWTQIKRMEEAGELVNTVKGWGLSSWYPSRPKGPEDGKKGKGGKKGKKKAAKKSATTTAKPEAAKAASGYTMFVGKLMKEGKTMAEAAAEWKKHKAGI